jgi:hypothetical protein
MPLEASRLDGKSLLPGGTKRRKIRRAKANGSAVHAHLGSDLAGLEHTPATPNRHLCRNADTAEPAKAITGEDP